MKQERTVFLQDRATGLSDMFILNEKAEKALEAPKEIKINVDGKTLDYIAYEEYGDTRPWRLLAEFNEIVNPYYLPEEIYVIPDELIQAWLNE